jgi:hypothetical protein
MEPWHAFDEGRTIGTIGSENGVILRDEEHQEGARITLERDGGTAPFSITMGVYDVMLHTRFCGTFEQGEQDFTGMKVMIERIITSWDPDDRTEVYAAIDELMKIYPSRAAALLFAPAPTDTIAPATSRTLGPDG